MGDGSPGSMEIRNDDPARTGEVVMIWGITDDGTEVPMTITLPPPPH